MSERNVQRITDVDQVISILKGTSIFRQVGKDDLKALLKTAIQRTAPAGTKIVEEGKEGIGFYLIIAGTAEVSKHGSKLATLKTGNFFGELSCIDGAARTADVIAASDVTCLVIPQWEMNNALESSPGVAQSMFRELVRRLRASNATLDTL
ncbi:cyclic nucleotide-binding domain-containing protein [Candidatus Bipolaricaulota bacterium]|nr:cyclic nucleotide-binding domain-containing protein [Candidatus Bipolaricaulota bacterium]